MPSPKDIFRSALAFLAAVLVVPCETDAADTGRVTIKLTQTHFECKEPMFSRDSGFERCEVYTVTRFTAPPDALLKIFGHCGVMIRYKTRDGMIENQETLHERFSAAIVDGSGLSPVTLTFKPTRLVFDPIVEARATDLRCTDEIFNN